VSHHDPSRPHAEAFMLALLVPLPTHDIHVTMPTRPTSASHRRTARRGPAGERELAAWADHVHSSVRTLARLFTMETGLSFARWRTRVRIRTAVQLLADGASVTTTARAVGYRRPSTVINAFSRVIGHMPGTYLHTDRRR
jgi:AraC-like DNA-binding protein